MLHVSALSFQRATINPVDRQTDRCTDTQTDYRMPRGSAHRPMISYRTKVPAGMDVCIIHHQAKYQHLNANTLYCSRHLVFRASRLILNIKLRAAPITKNFLLYFNYSYNSASALNSGMPLGINLYQDCGPNKLGRQILVQQTLMKMI